MTPPAPESASAAEPSERSGDNRGWSSAGHDAASAVVAPVRRAAASGAARAEGLAEPAAADRRSPSDWLRAREGEARTTG